MAGTAHGRPGSPGPLSASTDGLLDAAAALLDALPGAGPQDVARARRDAFEAAYRRWLVDHASVSGSPAERMDKVRLVLMAAATAPTLGGSLEMIVRFGRLVTPELSPARLGREGEVAVLAFDRARRDGVDGLIGELWPLALLLSEIECLAGRSPDRVEGTVRSAPVLPDDTAALLFDQPLRFAQPALALRIPARALAAPVVAGHDEASAFLPRLMADAFGAAPRRREAFAALLSRILRRDRLGGMQMPTLDEVAARLGSSPATLRRRLTEEGASFRRLRDAANNDLARRWLADEALSVAAVAERLGFSDTFSFSRFFGRLNGCTPARFRAALSENVGEVGGAAIVAGDAQAKPG